LNQTKLEFVCIWFACLTDTCPSLRIAHVTSHTPWVTSTSLARKISVKSRATPIRACGSTARPRALAGEVTCAHHVDRTQPIIATRGEVTGVYYTLPPDGN